MSNNFGRGQFGPFDIFGTPLAAWLGAGARIAEIINENGLHDDTFGNPQGRPGAMTPDDYAVAASDDPGEGLDRFVKKLKNSELRGIADSFRSSAEAIYDELSDRSQAQSGFASAGASEASSQQQEQTDELRSAWTSVGKKAAGVAEDFLDLVSQEIHKYQAGDSRGYNSKEQADPDNNPAKGQNEETE